MYKEVTCIRDILHIKNKLRVCFYGYAWQESEYKTTTLMHNCLNYMTRTSSYTIVDLAFLVLFWFRFSSSYFYPYLYELLRDKTWLSLFFILVFYLYIYYLYLYHLFISIYMVSIFVFKGDVKMWENIFMSFLSLICYTKRCAAIWKLINYIFVLFLNVQFFHCG